MAKISGELKDGVDLVGLRKQPDIRIAVCYILKAIGCPISKSGFSDSMQTEHLINFFSLNSALAYLAENGLIAEDIRADDTYYSILPAGAELSSRLETDIPTYFRDRAVSVALKVAARERIRQFSHTEVKKEQDGYRAVLSLTDGEELLMQTVLYAPDSLQANALCTAFEDDPKKLYTVIINTLTANGENIKES